MKTVFFTTKEILEGKAERCEGLRRSESPLPLSVIPNSMGINLCSVEGMSWTRQGDGQLVSLTIHFLPATEAEKEGPPPPPADSRPPRRGARTR